MGQVLTHQHFSQEPIDTGPQFNARRLDVCRALRISDRTLYRWEYEGVIWPYDDEHLDGHYVTLVSGRRRFCLERLRAQHVPGT